MPRRLVTLAVVSALLAGVAATVSVDEANAYRVTPNPVTSTGNWSNLQTALYDLGSFTCEGTSTCTSAQTSALKRARTKLLSVGARPLLRSLGTIGLATVAFEVGWKIGTPLGDYLYDRITVPNPAFANSAGGTCTGWKADVNSLVFQTAGSGGGQYPVDGWYVTFDNWQPNGTPNGTNITVSPSSTCLANYTATASGVGASSVSTGTGQLVFVVAEATAENSFRDAPVPWVAQATSATYTATAPTSTSATATSVRDIFLEDEATAIANVGTALEEETAAFAGGQAADPAWEGYPLPELTMPDCDGLTVAACTALLEADGYVGTITELELDIATADVTRPAGAVVTQSVGAGTSIEADADVTLEVNPDPLPLQLPEPLLGETYADYIARLAALGYVGTITETVLSEAAGDPELGPSAPVTIRIPAIGTVPLLTVRVGQPWLSPAPRLWPDTSIEISRNPDTYAPLPTPEPGTPASGGGGGSVPDVDFSPITDIDFGCKFPYGFICYAIDVTELFNVGADAPVFSFSLGTTEVGEAPYVVDLDVMDDYMSLLRSLIAVALWVGGVYYLATSLLGFKMGGDPGEAADEGLRW